MWHEFVTTVDYQQISYPYPYNQCRILSSIGATSHLRSCSDFGVIATPKRCVIRHISTRPSASFRLLRGFETRYVAVDVPLAKLGLTKCPEAGGAFKSHDNFNQDSFNQNTPPITCALLYISIITQTPPPPLLKKRH